MVLIIEAPPRLGIFVTTDDIEPTRMIRTRRTVKGHNARMSQTQALEDKRGDDIDHYDDTNGEDGE